jgi:hypothetical protein
VDGTLLKALPRIAEAMWLTTRTGTVHHAWRLHTHFELDKHVPVRLDLTNGKNRGPSDEKYVLRQNLQPDRGYVLDRWYAPFTLFNAIHRAGSSSVGRLRDNSVFGVVQEQALSPAAVAANVVRDGVVNLGLSSKGTERPDHPIRLVLVKVQPHAQRSHRKGNTGAGPSDGLLRTATDLLDVPAEIIALIYLYRYAIEIFHPDSRSSDPLYLRGIAASNQCVGLVPAGPVVPATLARSSRRCSLADQSRSRVPPHRQRPRPNRLSRTNGGSGCRPACGSSSAQC